MFDKREREDISGSNGSLEEVKIQGVPGKGQVMHTKVKEVLAMIRRQTTLLGEQRGMKYC
jgi:hypothetical protein